MAWQRAGSAGPRMDWRYQENRVEHQSFLRVTDCTVASRQFPAKSIQATEKKAYVQYLQYALLGARCVSNDFTVTLAYEVPPVHTTY